VSCAASLLPLLDVLYFALLCIGIRCLVVFLNSTCQEFFRLFVLERLLLLCLCTINPFEQVAVGLQYQKVSMYSNPKMYWSLDARTSSIAKRPPFGFIISVYSKSALSTSLQSPESKHRIIFLLKYIQIVPSTKRLSTTMASRELLAGWHITNLSKYIPSRKL
jgi:hypothetical protein